MSNCRFADSQDHDMLIDHLMIDEGYRPVHMFADVQCEGFGRRSCVSICPSVEGGVGLMKTTHQRKIATTLGVSQHPICLERRTFYLQLFLCCFNEISRVCLSKYYLDDHHQSQQRTTHVVRWLHKTRGLKF